MRPAGFFSIIRPLNSFVAGLAAIVAYLIATGTIVFGVILLMAVVVLITAAGNVINDYYDAEIDKINRPERPIPSGAVGRDAARRSSSASMACLQPAPATAKASRPASTTP